MVPILDVAFLTATSFIPSDRMGQIILAMSVGTLNIVSIAFVGSVLKFFHLTRTRHTKRDVS